MAVMLSAIGEQLESLQQLDEMLQQELVLITGSDPDALLSLVNAKNELLNKISESDALIRAMQLPEAQLDDSIKSQVNACRELLAKCQKQTQVNALALEKNQVRVQHLRNLILKTRHKESLTYDKAGITQGGSLGGSIKA